MADAPNKRRFRYSLRAMLAVVTLLCLWFGFVSQRAADQRRAVEIVRKYGGQVAYHHQHKPGRTYLPLSRIGTVYYDQSVESRVPRWLRSLLGDDYFMTVSEVSLGYFAVTTPSIYPTQMLPEELAALGKLRHMKTLVLEYTPQALPGITQFGEFESLECLILLNMTVDDAVWRQIGQFTGLRELIVANIAQANDPQFSDRLRVSEYAVAQLANLPRLRSLALCNAEIDADAASALSRLRQLESLQLNFSTITDDRIFLADFLFLQELDLFGTEITDITLQNVESLQLVRKLNIGNTRITDAGLAALQTLNYLQELSASDTHVTGAGLEGLVGLTRLELNHCPIDKNGLRAISQMQNLKYLSLEYTPLDDQGLAQLQQLPALINLELTGAAVTDTGLLSLTAPSLRRVSVRATAVTPAAANKLQKQNSIRVLTDSDPF